MGFILTVILAASLVVSISSQIVHLPPVYNRDHKPPEEQTFLPYEVPDITSLLIPGSGSVPSRNDPSLKVTSVNLVEPGQKLTGGEDLKISLEDLSSPPVLFNPPKPITKTKKNTLLPEKKRPLQKPVGPLKRPPPSLPELPSASVSFSSGHRIPLRSEPKPSRPPIHHFQVQTIPAPHENNGPTPDFIGNGFATSSVSFSG